MAGRRRVEERKWDDAGNDFQLVKVVVSENLVSGQVTVVARTRKAEVALPPESAEHFPRHGIVSWWTAKWGENDFRLISPQPCPKKPW